MLTMQDYNIVILDSSKFTQSCISHALNSQDINILSKKNPKEFSFFIIAKTNFGKIRLNMQYSCSIGLYSETCNDADMLILPQYYFRKSHKVELLSHYHAGRKFGIHGYNTGDMKISKITSKYNIPRISMFSPTYDICRHLKSADDSFDLLKYKYIWCPYTMKDYEVDSESNDSNHSLFKFTIGDNKIILGDDSNVESIIISNDNFTLQFKNL